MCFLHQEILTFLEGLYVFHFRATLVKDVDDIWCWDEN